MWPEFIVALKEFQDHLTSKRFLIIFGVLLLVFAYAMVDGMGTYNDMLNSYKTSSQQNQQQPWFQEQVASLQDQIQQAENSGAQAEDIAALQYQLDSMVNPPMPSMLFVFTDLNRYFILIGMVLSISMGFDLISRENEEGSLKSLLSHPVYRDAVVNGKTLGAITVLVVVLASAFLISMSIMLFYGIIPRADELPRILAYFLLALLYCLVFFSLAMMTSTVAKNSSMSVMYVLGIVVGLMIISMFSFQVTALILGPAPSQGGDLIALTASAANESGTSTGLLASGDQLITAKGVDQLQRDYYDRQYLISDLISSIAPMSNFGDHIAVAVLSQQVSASYDSAATAGQYGVRSGTVLDSLLSVWANILVLIVEIIIAFAISYVKFLRVDIR